MTTALWVCAGAFAYLGVGTTLTLFLSGLNEAIRKRRIPDDAFGPAIALWPATLFVAAVMTVSKSIAMALRTMRRSSSDVERIAAAEADGAAFERVRILALVAAEKVRASEMKQSAPRLEEWEAAFGYLAGVIVDESRVKRDARAAGEPTGA